MESVHSSTSDRNVDHACDANASDPLEGSSDSISINHFSPSELAPDAQRYAMSIVRSWADAEEIVQDSFCKILQAEKQTNSELIERSLFFRIVRNGCIDLLRIKNRRQLQTLGTATDLPHRPETDESALGHLESTVESSLKSMPSQWADALKLKLNGQLSYNEIASVLEATRAQVRTWIYRARKQLRQDLVEHNLIENENKS